MGGLGLGLSTAFQWMRKGASIPSRWNSLVVGWRLDETSGVRFDVLGVSDLTDNNTVGFAAGIIGNAASFVAANNESLTRASFVVAPSFTVAFWLKGGSLGADKDIVGCGTSWPSSMQFHFRSSPASVSFLVGSGAAFVQASSGLTNVNDGALHFIVGTFTDSDQKARLYIDGVEGNGSPSAALGASHYSTAATLFMGGGGVLGANTQISDETYVFSEAKDVAWITEMYNAGAGRSYPN